MQASPYIYANERAFVWLKRPEAGVELGLALTGAVFLAASCLVREFSNLKKRQMYCFQKLAQTLLKVGFYYVCYFLSKYPFPLKPSQSERQECYNSIIERTTGSTPHMLYLFLCLFSNNSSRLTR